MNYYIIGSKYGKQSEGFRDIFPSMLEKGVVATGFNWDEDLTHLIGKSHGYIINALKSKSESQKSYSTLKHFLNLKPGDLIAIKIHSAPSGKQARLVIGAYAVVKGLGNPIYKHCKELGHTIEVDFIETDLAYELPFGYGRTIHKIEDSKRIKPIFGYYSDCQIDLNNQYVELILKKTTDVSVKSSSGYILSRAHDKIQNSLAISLKNKYGDNAKIKMESSYIDVLVELEDKFILYEVKSSLCPQRCIREALGQIIQYGHSLKQKSNKSIEYVIVGPTKVDDSACSYYRYIKNIITEPLSYECVFA